MRGKRILIIAVLIALAFGVGRLSAGSVDSPAVPTTEDSQMYTLAQIYDRLDTGAAATKMTTFTEPSSGPGSTMHTLDEIMDLLKSTYTRVPRTGQNLCWDSSGHLTGCTGTGQDGEYQLGVLPKQEPSEGTEGAYTVYGWAGTRFTDNGDGTVSDNLTGLIWLTDANCFGERDWFTALNDANTLASGSCGLTDGSSAGQWRLPNINELHSLVWPGTGIALPHPFSGVQSAYYWSSTTREGQTPIAWRVDLSSGYVDGWAVKHIDNHYVWPVRGRQ